MAYVPRCFIANIIQTWMKRFICDAPVKDFLVHMFTLGRKRDIKVKYN